MKKIIIVFSIFLGTCYQFVSIDIARAGEDVNIPGTLKMTGIRDGEAGALPEVQVPGTLKMTGLRGEGDDDLPEVSVPGTLKMTGLRGEEADALPEVPVPGILKMTGLRGYVADTTLTVHGFQAAEEGENEEVSAFEVRLVAVPPEVVDGQNVIFTLQLDQNIPTRKVQIKYRVVTREQGIQNRDVDCHFEVQGTWTATIPGRDVGLHAAASREPLIVHGYVEDRNGRIGRSQEHNIRIAAWSLRNPVLSIELTEAVFSNEDRDNLTVHANIEHGAG